jgi:hypothetical protein
MDWAADDELDVGGGPESVRGEGAGAGGAAARGGASGRATEGEEPGGAGAGAARGAGGGVRGAGGSGEASAAAGAGAGGGGGAESERGEESPGGSHSNSGDASGGERRGAGRVEGAGGERAGGAAGEAEGGRAGGASGGAWGAAALAAGAYQGFVVKWDVARRTGFLRAGGLAADVPFSAEDVVADRRTSARGVAAQRAASYAERTQSGILQSPLTEGSEVSFELRAVRARGGVAASRVVLLPAGSVLSTETVSFGLWRGVVRKGFAPHNRREPYGSVLIVRGSSLGGGGIVWDDGLRCLVLVNANVADQGSG